MIKTLLENLLPAPLETLERIATEAAGLRHDVRESVRSDRRYGPNNESQTNIRGLFPRASEIELAPSVMRA